MHKFKVGDRVAVFGSSQTGKECYTRAFGRVTGLVNYAPNVWVNENAWVNVEVDEKFRKPGRVRGESFHFRQLRKVRKKAAPVEFECRWVRTQGIFHPCGEGMLDILGPLLGKRTKVRITVLD